MKIYLDRLKNPNLHYIEDVVSSYEIVKMEKDAFIGFIWAYSACFGEIHSCYSEFIGHIGRFRRDFGEYVKNK